MKLVTDKPAITLMGEFCDRAAEERYISEYMNSSKKKNAISVLFMGSVFFLLLIFDMMTYLSDYDITILKIDALVRGAVLLVCIACATIIIKTKKTSVQIAALTLSELVVFGGYIALLYLVSHYGAVHEFTDIAMAIMVIIVAVYTVPNRWICNVLVGVTAMVIFIATAQLYVAEMPDIQPMGGAIYLASAQVMAALYSRNLNEHRRVHHFREMQLEHLSVTDRLTRIYNRQKFDEVLIEWLTSPDRKGETFCLVMFDLDDFKMFNDTYGHLMGDRVLIGSVDAVNKTIRANDVFARWGGEEFMLLLPKTHLNEGILTAERLRRTIAAIHFENVQPITASFGVTEYRPDDTVDSLITRVDDYLYSAKEGGKNAMCSDLTYVPPETKKHSHVPPVPKPADIHSTLIYNVERG